MPCCMSPDARVYVVMTTAIPIQSAAMLYVDHVLRDGGVGARSRFQRGLPASSLSRSSEASIRVGDVSWRMGRVMPVVMMLFRSQRQTGACRQCAAKISRGAAWEAATA